MLGGMNILSNRKWLVEKKPQMRDASLHEVCREVASTLMVLFFLPTRRTLFFLQQGVDT